MTSAVWLWVSLVVLASVVFVAVTLWRRRRNAPSPQTPVNNQIIESETKQNSDGTTIAVPRTEAQPPPQQAWQRLSRHRYAPWAAALALVLLIGLGVLIYQLVGGSSSRADRFVVVVTPFRDLGGSASQTGRSVAQELVRSIQDQATTNETAMLVEFNDNVPNDASAAYELARRLEADVLIWGEVSAGGVLDQESLLPQLAYAPNGQFAPNAWIGYMGRFSMPQSFLIANSPINGRVVLPPLVAALADYANNDSDIAFGTLGNLIDNYPALSPSLFRTFRGNILWARGAYEQAASEYQAAIGANDSDIARLENNLSAIYLDAQDPRALEALDRSLQALRQENRDMGELRFNLALVALLQDRPNDALAGLEAARNGLLPANTPLLVTIARAQRESGSFDAAQNSLALANEQLANDANSVPSSLATIVRENSRAAIQEEYGLLELARLAGGTGPLTWELEAMSAPTSKAVQPARSAFEASVNSTNTAATAWRSFETTNAARNRPGASLIDNGQARRVEQLGDHRNLLLNLARLESTREDLARDPGLVGSLFGNLLRDSGSIANVQSNLATILSNDPNNLETLMLYARVLRLRRQSTDADLQYDRIISLAPNAPEGPYGKAMLALDRGDLVAGKSLLNQSLNLNDGYFPARQVLARLAMNEQDWPTAIQHLNWLAINHARPADQVALAQALRLSGSRGYEQAKSVLQPLADAQNVDALVELGRLYNDMGQTADARNSYEQAVRADPKSGPALFELGETLAIQGEYEAAESRMRAAIDANPNNIDARLALAKLYMGPLDKPDMAADLYSSLLELGINDPETLTNMGDELLDRGRAAEAIQAYRKALTSQPENRFLFHKIGQAQLAQGDLNNARQSEQQALDLAGGVFPQALTGLGDIARRSNDFDQALNYYNQALSQDPSLVGARIGLGQSLAAQGNWLVALSQFQEAASREPENPTALFWLGEAELRQQSYAAAINTYNTLLGLDPNFTEAYLGLAQAQLDSAPNRSEGITTAIATIDKALAQRSRYAEGLLFKGKLLQEQSAYLGSSSASSSKLNEALQHYSNAISANGNLAEPYYRRGLIYLQRSNYTGAESDLRAAIERQGNFAEAHYWLGRTYYAGSDLNRALASFKTAVGIQGGNYAEALLYQGMVEDQLGDRAAAASSFQAVIQVDGASQWASAARQELARVQD
jgi:tetratricopeptide (TPR) repeat protein